MAEGRLVNLAAGDGHPAEIMDLSFAMQTLAARYLLQHGSEMEAKVYTLPHELDTKVASIKLASMGYKIDTSLKPRENTWDLTEGGCHENSH